MALRNELKQQGDFLFKNRSYLPVIILITGLYVYIHNESTKSSVLDTYLYELICFSVCLLGLIIRFISVGFSSDNTSGRNTGVGQVADSINTTGLYSLCRHPLYIGNFFMWAGIAGFTQNFWFIIAFIFLYWIYYERIMYAEEEFLIKTYGQKYLDYSKNTPAVLLKFKNWTKPKNSFSYIKILRQEKAGILNLFLVIFVFKLARYLILNMEIEIYWIYGIVFGVVWYIVMKVLQKTTKILSSDR